MNDTQAIGTPASGASPAATQVLPTAAESAAARSADVRAYVTAVRTWLADLPADEVEDLTAGMEADLDERAAETGERLGVLLGEPEAYAAELRAAAGLAPRAASVPDAGASGPGLIETMVTSMRAKGDGILTRWPWLRELRPTWWLARGAALGWWVALALGVRQYVALSIIGAAMSFWLGKRVRGQGPLRPKAGLIVGVANVVLAVVLLSMSATFTSAFSRGYEDGDNGGVYFPSEAAANGEPLRNVYAYDAAGNRLDGVRLFDQAGRPIVVDQNQLWGDEFVDVPLREDGTPDVALDLFPLRWQGHDAWAGDSGQWVPPLVLAPVPGVTPSAAVSPTPSASPAPSASPTSVPSPTSVGSPTPSPSQTPSP